MEMVRSIIFLISIIPACSCDCLQRKCHGSLEAQCLNETSDQALSVVVDNFFDWHVYNKNKSIITSAIVPGDIYTDLLRNQSLGLPVDPYFGQNDVSLRWISMETWEYSSFFMLNSSIAISRSVLLVLDGIDTISTVFINDKPVGNTYNMFVQYTIPISSYVLNGMNKLSIMFASPVSYAKSQSDKSQYPIPPACPVPVQNGECHVNFIRKGQFSFSWDWGPAFPTMGIWKPLRIIAFNTTTITETTVQVTKVRNSWTVAVTSYFNTQVSLAGQIQVKLPALVRKKLQPLSLKPGFSNFTVSIENISSSTVKLWWPNGYGEPVLYNLTIDYDFFDTSSDSAGYKATESIMRKIGFRTVELDQRTLSAGRSFSFVVNDVPIFVKGSNWIPADSFLSRVNASRIDNLLSSAVSAHMNMLRVWGGGVYESDDFYSLADEKGLMIWQDFMFACSMYPTTAPFISNVQAEVRHQIKRLMHHPSIAIWSGNNENEVALVQNWYLTAGDYNRYKQDYIKLYVDTIMAIVKELYRYPTALFVTSSPSNGVESISEGYIAKYPQSTIFGDVHFYNYYKDGWDWRIFPKARFVSEYGFQSWPSFETLKKYGTNKDWTSFQSSNFMQHHQHHFLGNEEMLLGVSRHFRLPSENESSNETQRFIDTLYLTQVYQAVSMKTETELYRTIQSRLFPNSEGMTKGAMYWQLNDIWPGASWSSIEYGGRWKMLHYFAKKFFSPVLPTIMVENNMLNITLVSDLVKLPMNTSIVIDVYRYKSLTPVWSTKILSKLVAPQSAVLCYTTNLTTFLSSAGCSTSSDGNDCIMNVHLLDQDGTRLGVDNSYWFTNNFSDVFKEMERPILSILSVRKLGRGEFEVQVDCNRVALFVWLSSGDIAGEFSDNGFIMFTAAKSVQFTMWYGEDADVTDIRQSVSVMSVEDIYHRN